MRSQERAPISEFKPSFVAGVTATAKIREPKLGAGSAALCRVIFLRNFKDFFHQQQTPYLVPTGTYLNC